MDLVSLVTGLTGLISGFWVAYTFHRKIQVENVLQERTKWRERVRELASNIVSNPTAKDVAELEIRLNPLDPNDQKIVEIAKDLLADSDRNKRDAFLKHVARLLKYDWERAKNETSIFGFFMKIDERAIRDYE